jgi:hypothetical protein
MGSFWDKLKRRFGYKEKKRAVYLKLGKIAAKQMAEEAEDFLFGPEEEEEEEIDPEEQARLEAKAAREREKAEKKRRKEEARAAKQREAEIDKQLEELKRRAGQD